LANPSELGGLLEFFDDVTSRALSSSIRTNATLSCNDRSITLAANRVFSASTRS
jgi:hypothetical protein